MGLLDGKVAIITGAGGGLGRCLAEDAVDEEFRQLGVPGVV